MNPLSCIPLPVKDWTYTIFLGALVTTYWRGSWVLLDIWLCDQPSTASLVGGDSFCFMVQALVDDYPDGYYWNLRLKSARITYGIGLALLFVGVTLLWSGAWVPRFAVTPEGTVLPECQKVTKSLAVVRFIIVYIMGASAVCTWRGIWYWADAWILPLEPLKSYWLTSVVGSTACFLCGAGNSLLAPPAIFLTDGPGENPPPIGVTALSSYYSVTLPYYESPPKLPLYVRIIDMVGSFVFLPFAVVWFWRGTWLLFDHYFWGFTLESVDVWYSKLWGFIFAVICIVLTCEPVFAFFDRMFKNRTVLGLVGRLRTYILAWGTVSFWRVAWYVWDEFLGGTSLASAIASHVISLVCLTAMGCVSSINAPASTLGVDAVPHKECDDEPLFSMIPIPYDLLYVFGIGRQLSARETVADKEKTHRGELELSGAAGEEGPLGGSLVAEAEKWAKEHEAEEEEEEAPADEKPDNFEEESPTAGEEPLSSAKNRSTIMSFVPGSWSGAGRPSGRSSTFFELQRPQLSSRRYSEGLCSQRPGEGNPRNRTSLFRSR